MTVLIRLSGKRGKEFDLIVKSPQIELPLYDSVGGDLIGVDNSYEFRLTVKMKQDCQLGYEMKSTSDGFNFCQICHSGMYSLMVNEPCVKC